VSEDRTKTSVSTTSTSLGHTKEWAWRREGIARDRSKGGTEGRHPRRGPCEKSVDDSFVRRGGVEV